MGFLSRVRYRFQSWMAGRNGADTLSRDLNILALVLMFVDLFTHIYVLYILGFLIFCVAFYRTFSRNLARRSAENAKYMSKKRGILRWFSTRRQELVTRRQYRYYSCSICKQRLRVPRGKGKIEITCPKCANHFIKKT